MFVRIKNSPSRNKKRERENALKLFNHANIICFTFVCVCLCWMSDMCDGWIWNNKKIIIILNTIKQGEIWGI